MQQLVFRMPVSVDASSRDTFETLRLGGEWEARLRSLHFISGLRRQNIAKRFTMSFTYQAENYQEMPAFVALAKSLHCDTVLFEQLQNLRWSDEEYRRRAVNKPA